MLAWRWSFEGVYLCDQDGFLDSISRGSSNEEAMRRFFLDYKLVLRKNNTFDLVVFKKYLHGTWAYADVSKTLTLTAEKPTVGLTMQVDSISPAILALRVRQQELNKLIPANMYGDRGFSYFQNHGPYVFVLSADKEKYNNEKEDPYSTDNNLWRIKPASPETDKQLAARVVNHVQFVRSMMQDVVDGRKTYISLHSFHTPLIMDANDIRLQHYEDIQDEWKDNFYDTAQAKKGFDLLEKAVLYNGVKPGATNDRFVNSSNMLGQVIEHLEGSTK